MQEATRTPAAERMQALVLTAAGLELSWPEDHTGWRLLTQTNNLASGLSSDPNDWGDIDGAASTNRVVLPVNAGQPAGFFRLVYP